MKCSEQMPALSNRPFQMQAWSCITSYPLWGLPYLAYDNVNPAMVNSMMLRSSMYDLKRSVHLSPCGMHVIPMWYPYGVHVMPMWYACDIHGCANAVWANASTFQFIYFHVVCMWYPCGTHMVYMWCPWSMHVISMDVQMQCEQMPALSNLFISMWYACDTHVVPIWCTCDAHEVCLWYPWMCKCSVSKLLTFQFIYLLCILWSAWPTPFEFHTTPVEDIWNI